jgi:hypothetical protein
MFMQVNPQYTFDKHGNALGVFLSIDEWNELTEELNIEIPDWQKEIIEGRLNEYKTTANATSDMDNFLEELDREDLNAKV